MSRAIAVGWSWCDNLKSNIPGVLITSIIVYVFGTILYAKAVHPLRAFPGPTIATASRIPYWIASLTGNQVRWIQQLHQRYGPTVRYGPNDLSYADGQAWKDICGYEKGRPENPKDRKFFGPPKNGVESMITADIEDHARVRRVFSAAFSERALKSQSPLFVKYSDMMIANIRQAISQEPGVALDMVQRLNFTTFDLMSDLTFGEPLGLLEKNNYTPWVELVFKSIAILPIVQITEYYPAIKAIFSLLEPKSVANIRLSHFQHSTNRVDQRISRGSDQPDIWNLVLSAHGDRALTIAEMHSNAEIFMTGGTETTATLLSGLLYFLLTNRSKMAILTSEIRGAFDTDADINWERLQGLKYLNACLEEALRMYPPVPSALPRVTPEGGNIILGKWVAAGTCVSVHHTATYRSPLNFTNPDRFAPERWLGDPTYKSDKRDALKPFSYGPRNCLGQNMAYHEMRLFAAKLLYNFDFELCDESRNWNEQKVYVLWQKKPLMCRIRPISRG